MHAWILFAHGSSDPDWARPMRGVEARLASTLGAERVALAFLERQAPTLEEAAAGLIDRGATRISIVPMFLGIGGHLRRDLPTLVAGLGVRWTDVAFELAAPIGESPQVARAIEATVVELAAAQATPASAR